MASAQENGSWKYPLPLNNYINGKWQDNEGKKFLTVYSAVDDSIVTEGKWIGLSFDCITDSIYIELVSATSDDVDVAVQSAGDALSIWQSMSAVSEVMGFMK
jgi:acyl-CoA reductase-like NAD-dependent aldehyde dehydrogenase